MVAKTRILTLEEFLALPEEKPALELIDGEVCQKAVGTKKHAHAQRRLARLLEDHPATQRGGAWTELSMPFPGAARANLRIPDVSYFRPGRDAGDPYPDAPADLAVEIRSPGQTVASQLSKLAFFREQGVPVTLLIDPETETVHVHDSGREWTAGRDETVTLAGLDGFSFAVVDLFLS